MLIYPLSVYQQARVSRDPRFDGLFFICVKTTGIFCRTICPANLPHEKNVIYLDSREEAISQGFRPCLRCKPDLAPSFMQIHKSTELCDHVAQKIITGDWLMLSVEEIAKKVNTSPRNLNKLFNQSRFMSVKEFQNIHKSLYAKSLLQNSDLSVLEIAMACGYSSLSAFYYLVKKYLKTDYKLIAKEQKNTNIIKSIKYPIQHHYDWDYFLDFQSKRLLIGLEWIEGKKYGRTFIVDNIKGYFEIYPDDRHFIINIYTPIFTVLHKVLHRIIRMFDLDVNITAIESHLISQFPSLPIRKGVHIPGVLTIYEAGLRAICGQQVSVAAATKLLNKIITLYGEVDTDGRRYLPRPQSITLDTITAIKTTHAKHNTLVSFCQWISQNEEGDPEDLLVMKGIGEWTVNYIKLRALKNPNIWLESDLGIKQAIKKLGKINHLHSEPWNSYLTLQLWNTL